MLIDAIQSSLWTTYSYECIFISLFQVAYVFDNEFTVVFAIFMSLWGKFGTCSRPVMATRSVTPFCES